MVTQVVDLAGLSQNQLVGWQKKINDGKAKLALVNGRRVRCTGEGGESQRGGRGIAEGRACPAPVNGIGLSFESEEFGELQWLMHEKNRVTLKSSIRVKLV